MLEMDEIQEFFKEKTDIHVEFVNVVLRFRLKDGIYEHDVNAPDTIEKFQEAYEKVKKELQELDGIATTASNVSNPTLEVITEASGCSGCGGNQIREVDNEVWGVESLLEAKASGDAPEAIQKERFAICKNCQIKDVDGNRLYREQNGKSYCGIPRLEEFAKIKRDERHWGCGCDLQTKVLYNASKCPFVVWDAVQI